MAGLYSEKKSSLDGGVDGELAQVPSLARTGTSNNLNRPQFVVKGELEYIGEEGGNNAGYATYQEVHGAPVEAVNPLGYQVGFWTTLFLNISMLIGTGIFSTPANILRQTGSVGLSLIYWVIGWLISLSGISVYLEFMSFYPSRSGSEVVYLEQAYPKPKYFFPVTFAFLTVVLSFSSSNAFVVAQYIFRIVGRTASPWEQKGVAVAAITVVAILVVVSNKLVLRLINILGVIKIATLLFITFSGFAVLAGRFPDKVKDPKENFRNSFKGTSDDGYNLSNALVSIIFSYGGYNNSFNVANEVKDPIRTIRRTANGAVTIVFVLYFLVNIAYFAALPKTEIIKSSQVTASLYFKTLFGDKAAKGLTILPVLSALGNMMASKLGHSRMIREIGRQGVVPYPEFFVSTKPFGTPGGAVLFSWFMSLIMILAPPAGSAFNFIIALQNYPSSFFMALMTFGLWLVRRRRAQLNLPPSGYRSWNVAVVFFFLAKIFLIIMPWVPPKAGINASAFGFFYAASSLTGMGFIGLCGIYYVVWTILLPKWRHYQLRQIVAILDDGSVQHKLIKVPNDKIEEWDAKHDLSGRSITSSDEGDNVEYIHETKA
ncbi:hypothetical protein Q8F55_001080 [Vanrija albida]|uniref:Amino acid permease/ SLC12A domain-containing protein n=1 Tax=Vanrija albida TaxID=181172 RepID=A0ABR3QF31_9TREE